METLAEVEIALFLIFVFFSGVWGAIKLVDDQTDNKLVFFVPAAVLTLFLLSGTGEGFAFLACLFAIGPIIAMLVKVGLEQGKEGVQTSFGVQTSYASYGERAVQPMRLNRKLAPGYIRAYDRLIGYIQAQGGAIKSREDGIRRLSEIYGAPESNVERFFDSPYVIKTLGLKEELSKEPETVGDDWWEKGYSGDEGVSDASPKTVVEMEPSPIPSTIEVGSEDACGETGCSTAVTAFDFRCFTCRKRFCQSHAGSSVHCSNCES